MHAYLYMYTLPSISFSDAYIVLHLVFPVERNVLYISDIRNKKNVHWPKFKENSKTCCPTVQLMNLTGF